MYRVDGPLEWLPKVVVNVRLLRFYLSKCIYLSGQKEPAESQTTRFTFGHQTLADSLEPKSLNLASDCSCCWQAGDFLRSRELVVGQSRGSRELDR